MKDITGENQILFSGYAKLPTGITASEIYKVVGIIVTVDGTSGEILAADCTLATELARKHICNILLGNTLKDSPEKLLRTVEKVYQGSAKKALITAIRIIYDKFHAYQEGLLAETE